MTIPFARQFFLFPLAPRTERTEHDHSFPLAPCGCAPVKNLRTIELETGLSIPSVTGYDAERGLLLLSSAGTALEIPGVLIGSREAFDAAGKPQAGALLKVSMLEVFARFRVVCKTHGVIASTEVETRDMANEAVRAHL